MFPDDVPISVEEANQIAQELTVGEVSVEIDGTFIRLVRNGYQRSLEIDPVFDMTRAGIRNVLRGWDMWDDA